MALTWRGLALAGAALTLVGAVMGVNEVLGADDGLRERPRVGPEVPVTTNDLRRTRAQNSPAVLADPTEPRFVALANRWDAPQFSCALHVSGDGGGSWLEVDPVPELPAGADRCYAPEIAFDDEGVLYYLFVGLQGLGNEPMGVFLTSSDDRAKSFAPPHQILGAGNYQVRMALDRTHGERGRLHLVWLQTAADSPLGGLPPPPNPIVAAHSDDGGRSFSKPVTVNPPERRLAVAPALAIGRDHRVHVLYYDLGDDVRDYQGLEGPTWDGNWSLVHASSVEAGGQFAAGSVVDDGLVPPERVMLIFTMPPPALAVDGSGGVYAAWYDARNRDWDVFLRASHDDGATWTPRRRLNDDPPGRHQYLPRLSTSPDGRVDAVFYDRREDADNVRNDVFYTSSHDRGRHFSANVKLTSRSSSSRVGQIYTVPSAEGLVEFGGRIALFSKPGEALVAWADTRNAGDSVQQDIYSAAVDVAVPRRTALGIPGILLAAGLLMLVISVLGGRRPRLRAGSLVAVALLGGMTSCRSDPVSLPGSPPVVAVTMSEYRYDYTRPVPAGRVVFETRNAGNVEHELILAPLPPDYPPIEEQVRGSEQRILQPLYYLRALPPGASGAFAVDLEPGRYAMVCFISGADEKSYAVKGMTSEFRVA